MRDYTAYEIQNKLQLIKDLRDQEQIIQEEKANRNTQARKDAEEIATQLRKKIIRETSFPSAAYHFLEATEDANPNEFRAEWQKWLLKNKTIASTFPNDYLVPPSIDLTILPAYTFWLKFTFTLSQSYISRDEQNFYILDNPIRKDKISDLPYVASSSWKGSLRAALWQLGFKHENSAITHLFGAKKENEAANMRSGRLYFFPTFFHQRSLEVINPQNRISRAGENPIPIESVPSRATGDFQLLYVPFDLIGGNETEIRKQVAEELNILAKGLAAMFSVYGFGAKTRSGFGLAKETISGSLKIRIRENATQDKDTKSDQTAPAPSLARYLEAPNRLKPEYLKEDGTFRERSDAELKKMHKGDRQVYEKAKNWWDKEGKRAMEEPEKSQLLASSKPAPPEIITIKWPEWDFSSFEQLNTRVETIADKLTNIEER